MKTECGNTEGHAALLKLHQGAYLNRTDQGGARTRVVRLHAPHRLCKKEEQHTVEISRISHRRRSSCVSTKFGYPGLRESPGLMESPRLPTILPRQKSQTLINFASAKQPELEDNQISKTYPGGAQTRVVHPHRPHPLRNEVVQPAVQTPELSRRRRLSCASTKISYPGLTGSSRLQRLVTHIISEQKLLKDGNYETAKEKLADNVQVYSYASHWRGLIKSRAKKKGIAKEDDDDDDDQEAEVAARSRSVQEEQEDMYNKMCRLQRIAPCEKYKRQMNDTVADLSNSRLGTKDIKSICVSLTSNVTIKELDLSGNDLSCKGAPYLAEALRENTSIEDLTLCECNIDLEGLRALSEVFLERKPMKRLDMSRNNFERSHAEILCEVIKKNDYIEELVLSGNKFDDVGGVVLGKALERNVGIKNLDLSWNHLRREGAKSICMALKFNTTLEELNLSWNGLAEDGCRALELSLPYNHTLRELDISCNRITPFCLKYLLKGIERNDTLRILKINENPMTTEGAIAMVKCLAKSETCQIADLYMTDIPINSDFLGELDELLKVRTVRVYHRDPNKKKITPIIRQRTLRDYDPAMILFEYMKQENLRLIDLFRTFDTDSSQSVSKDELKEGFLTINMPLTEGALDSLFQRLDINDNDEIDYNEIKVGYRKAMVKLRDIGEKNENNAALIQGLRSLVKRAAIEKRKAMQDAANTRQPLQPFKIRKR